MSRHKFEMSLVLPEIARSTVSSKIGLKIERSFTKLVEALHGDRCIQATREIKRYRHLLEDAPLAKIPVDRQGRMQSSRMPAMRVDKETVPANWSPTKVLIVFCVAIFGLLHVFAAMLMQRPPANALPDRWAFLRSVE